MKRSAEQTSKAMSSWMRSRDRRPHLAGAGVTRDDINRFARGQITGFEEDRELEKLLELRDDDVVAFHGLPPDVRTRVAAYAEAKTANDRGET